MRECDARETVEYMFYDPDIILICEHADISVLNGSRRHLPTK